MTMNECMGSLVDFHHVCRPLLKVVSNASIQHPINPVFVFMYVHINCLILGSEQFIKFQVLVTLSS